LGVVVRVLHTKEEKRMDAGGLDDEINTQERFKKKVIVKRATRK